MAKLIFLIPVLLLLSCFYTVVQNNGYNPDILKNQKIYFSKPIILSASHTINTKPTLFILGQSVDQSSKESKKNNSYNKTSSFAFCRDVEFAASDKGLNWKKGPDLLMPFLQKSFRDTTIIPLHLPDSAIAILKKTNVQYYVVFHNFHSDYSQSEQLDNFSFGNSTMNSSSTSMSTKLSTRVSLYDCESNTMLYSFDISHKSQMSMEPTAQKIFSALGL